MTDYFVKYSSARRGTFQYHLLRASYFSCTLPNPYAFGSLCFLVCIVTFFSNCTQYKKRGVSGNLVRRIIMHKKQKKKLVKAVWAVLTVMISFTMILAYSFGPVAGY